MDVRYDVIVVGSGVVGLFVAYEAYRVGLSVLVIDKEVEPGFGVSRRHAGVIHVLQPPFGSLKSVLALEGNKEYDNVAKKLGVPFVRLNTILVATSLPEFLASFVIYLYLKAKGYPVRWVSGRWLRKGEPSLSRRVKGGIVVANYGVIDSFSLIYSLYDALKDSGVDFRLGCRVVDVKEADGVVVETTCGNFVGKCLVNAAGLYADEIAKMSGLDVEIKPGKGVMAVFAGLKLSNIITPIPLRTHPRTKGGAIIPTVYGTVIVGPSFAEVEEKEDFSVESESFELLKAKFERLIEGGFSKLIPVKVYAGNRPLSPTGDFIIERKGNIVHVLGAESPAFTAAPAIAKRVLKLMGVELNYVRDVERPRPYRKGGRVVCPCRGVTEEEVREAVRRGSKTLDGVMFRLGIGMGPCQGSRCMAEVIKIISEELGVKPSEVTKFGEGSWLVL